MHDPKFEKEVQQKMEELKFSPSEEVWTKLEKDLQKEKRRSLPLFWLLFLAGGMLLGAGGTWLFYAHSNHAAVPASSELTRNPPRKTDRQNAVVEPGGADQPRPATGRGIAGPRISGIAQGGAYRPKTRRSSGMPGTAPAGTFVASKLMGTVPNDRDEDDQSEITVERSAVSDLPAQVGSGFDGNSITVSSKNIPANVVAKSSAAKKLTLYKTPVWEAGFTGGAGISGVNNGLFQRTMSSQLSAVPNSGPTPAYLFNNLANGAPVRSNYSPKVGSGLSFWAGIFVQKPVLKRLSLSVGLNVHYYSTQVVTGQQVTNIPATPSNSLFYPSLPASSSQSYPYYPTGNSYSYLNRYYFLELPVSLQWQVNPGRRIPLFWEGGLSVTRLMSVNALYYNESSGVYYKYGGQSNPVRLFASTAFMAGLRWRDTRIQLGPEFQYGLTRLSNENSNSGQHLFYGGIKITVVPGRK